MAAHRTDQLTVQPSVHQFDRQFAELEQRLQHADPALVQRLDRLQRAEARHAVTVFSLLTAAAVLLAAALATASPVAAVIGAALFLVSFRLDDRYRRNLRRPLPSERSDPLRGDLDRGSLPPLR